MAENSASPKYDAVKGITIRSAFVAKGGYFFQVKTSVEFPEVFEVQTFVGFREVNFLLRESSQGSSI